MTVKDGRFEGGRIALAAYAPKNLRIEGTVNRDWYRKQVAVILATRFREWREFDWNRVEEIPAWARNPGTATPAPTSKQSPPV